MWNIVTNENCTILKYSFTIVNSANNVTTITTDNNIKLYDIISQK